VLAQVNKTRIMLNTTKSLKHVLWYDKLLRTMFLMKGRMIGKPIRGRSRLQMLDDLYKNNSCEDLAEDRSARIESI